MESMLATNDTVCCLSHIQQKKFNSDADPFLLPEVKAKLNPTFVHDIKYLQQMTIHRVIISKCDLVWHSFRY